MKTLAELIRWDLMIQSRYQILTALSVVTFLYLILFWLVPGIKYDELLITIIFSDPALLGVTFVGALVLFEKDENTLDALVVTPMKDWQYLWSKAISLTISATIVGVLLAIVGHGWDMNYLIFISTLILTSILYLMLGIIFVANVSSLNEYVIKMALAVVVISLPLLNLFGITESLLLYVIPAQASLLLFQWSFGVEIAVWEIIYGYSYLLLGIFVMYILARRAYHKYIIK